MEFVPSPLPIGGIGDVGGNDQGLGSGEGEWSSGDALETTMGQLPPFEEEDKCFLACLPADPGSSHDR
jgi:hypothetical protein